MQVQEDVLAFTSEDTSSSSEDTSSPFEDATSSFAGSKMANAATTNDDIKTSTRKKARKPRRSPPTPKRASKMTEVTTAHTKLVEFTASGKAIAKLAELAKDGSILYVEEKETMVPVSLRTKYVFTSDTDGSEYWVNKELVPNGSMKLRLSFRADTARLSNEFVDGLKALKTATVWVYAEMNDKSPVTSEAVLNPTDRCFFHFFVDSNNHSMRLRKMPDNQKPLKYEYGWSPVLPLNALKPFQLDPETDMLVERPRTYPKYMELTVSTSNRFTTYFLHTAGAPRPTDKCYFKRVGSTLHVTTEKAPGLLLHNIAISRRYTNSKLISHNGKKQDMDQVQEFSKIEEMEEVRRLKEEAEQLEEEEMNKKMRKKAMRRCLIAEEEKKADDDEQEESGGEETVSSDQEDQSKQDDKDDDDIAFYERRATMRKNKLRVERHQEEKDNIWNQLFAPPRADHHSGDVDDEDDEEEVNVPAILPSERKRKMTMIEDAVSEGAKKSKKQKLRHYKEDYDKNKYRTKHKQQCVLRD